MKLDLSAVKTELKAAYEEMGKAANEAELQGDRAAARKIRERLSDLMREVDDRLDWTEKLLGQPSLAKYFR